VQRVAPEWRRQVSVPRDEAWACRRTVHPAEGRGLADHEKGMAGPGSLHGRVMEECTRFEEGWKQR
jgi:hypothetical protein